MQHITNDRDYRIGYEVLGIMQKTIAVDGSNHGRRKALVDLKRNLRQYAHRDTGVDRRIIKDEGMDGFISLERLPDGIEDLDEAEAFFERFMYFPCPNSMYDCTGRPFTSWFKVFKRNDKFYAYHSVGVDV